MAGAEGAVERTGRRGQKDSQDAIELDFAPSEIGF